MTRKSTIILSQLDRKVLDILTSKGKQSVRTLKRALILLRSDAGDTHEEIAQSVEVSIRTVQRIRVQYLKHGLSATLYDSIRPGVAPRLDKKNEAFLIHIARLRPPHDRTRWTLDLLREKLIRDQVVTSISIGTIHAYLVKHGVNLSQKKHK